MNRLLALALLLVCDVALAATLIGRVERGTDSVILNAELYDATNPEDCPSTDLTHSTQDLVIKVYDDKTSGGLVDTFECTGAACATTDTIADITTLNVYTTPPANSMRFKVMEAGSCWYQFQFPNAIFDTADVNVINVQVTAPGIIAGNFWVDMSVISDATLIAALLDTSCTSYATPDDVGYQLCTRLNANATDLGIVKSSTSTTEANTSFALIAAEQCDSGSTTTCTDSDEIDTTDNRYVLGAELTVEFGTGPLTRCIVGHTGNTLTVYPAFDQPVTAGLNFQVRGNVDCRNP